MKSLFAGKFDMGFISKSRNVIFGIATIMIISSHVPKLRNVSSFDFVNDFVWFILEYGNLGVDLFLFLSGIGLYYSFSKNQSIITFYKRRAGRILPELYLVIILFSITILKLFNIPTLIARLFLVSFFLKGERFFWFFSILILLYIIYPFIYAIYERFDYKGFLMLLAYLFFVISIIRYIYPQAFFDLEIGLLRIPVFLIGAYAAKYVKKGTKLPLVPVMVLSLLTVIAFVLIQFRFFDFISKHYYLQRLMYCPLAIALIILMSAVIPLINENVISKFLVWLGGYSCEIYLLFDKIGYSIWQRYETVLKGKQILFVYYFVLLIVSVILSVLLKKYNNMIVKLFSLNKGSPSK